MSWGRERKKEEGKEREREGEVVMERSDVWKSLGKKVQRFGDFLNERVKKDEYSRILSSQAWALENKQNTYKAN